MSSRLCVLMPARRSAGTKARQIPAFYFYLSCHEGNYFSADPVYTPHIPPASQRRWTEGRGNFLRRQFSGMPDLLKPLPEILALWKNPFQTQRPLSELSVARTSPADLALPEGKDGLLFGAAHRSSYRPGIMLYETL